jgi:hypothetical protein
MLRLALSFLLLALPALAQQMREVALRGGRSDRIALHGGGGSPDPLARTSGLTAPARAAGLAAVWPAGTARRGGPLLAWNGLCWCDRASWNGGCDDLRRGTVDFCEVRVAAPERIVGTGFTPVSAVLAAVRRRFGAMDLPRTDSDPAADGMRGYGMAAGWT